MQIKFLAIFLCIANTADPSLLFNRLRAVYARALVETIADQFKPFPRILGIQLCTRGLESDNLCCDIRSARSANRKPYRTIISLIRETVGARSHGLTHAQTLQMRLVRNAVKCCLFSICKNNLTPFILLDFNLSAPNPRPNN